MHTRQSARRGAAAMTSAVAQALRYLAIAGLLVAGSAVHAQNPAPPGMDPKTAAGRRFPQPVRVGSLIGHAVLRPVESQDVLGKVDRLIRRKDGGVDVVVDYGGLFGLGARPIAVPIEAMVVLGDVMEIVDPHACAAGQISRLRWPGDHAAPAGRDRQSRLGPAIPLRS